MDDKTVKADLMVVQLDRARTALAEAKTIGETKKIMDMAHAAQIYARRQQLGEEAMAYAHSIKYEALRKLGEILASTPKAKPGTKPQFSSTLEPNSPTLAELQINRKVAMVAQQLAAMPAEAFERVRDADRKLAHVAHATGQNEWYTPSEFIESARKTMGVIDLDPASCSAANVVVKARKFYSIADDGLSKSWGGCVWLNPPYAADLVVKFAEKLAENVISGNVTQACVLVNNATETKWMQAFVEVASAVCFPAGRVKFWQPDKDSSSPLQGQIIIYIGGKPAAFVSEFNKFGWCARIAL